MSTKKKMNIEEFVEFGYLQEANRRYFHPLGLELEVGPSLVTPEEGEEREIIVSGILDRRSGTKVLLRKVDLNKVLRVTSEMKARRPARWALPECNNGGFQNVPRG